MGRGGGEGRETYGGDAHDGCALLEEITQDGEANSCYELNDTLACGNDILGDVRLDEYRECIDGLTISVTGKPRDFNHSESGETLLLDPVLMKITYNTVKA